MRLISITLCYVIYKLEDRQRVASNFRRCVLLLFAYHLTNNEQLSVKQLQLILICLLKV